MSESGEAAVTAVSIGVPKETLDGERRVSLVPNVIGALTKAGASIVVESGAGAAAGFADSAYSDKGAKIGSRADVFAADIVTMVRVADDNAASPDLAHLRRGQVVVGMAAPLARPEVSAAVANAGATLFALELVPRTTRAQNMDVLSSQANIAGYRAVLIAASELPKMFPMMTTAAGTISPARVFVMGAGVAGLSAIATARRLGAVVEAYDVRAAVKEEVESLGARFVEVALDTGQEGGGSGAYAQKMTDEQLAQQRQLLTKTISGSDVVITTAQVQGAKAPLLVTSEMMAGMSPSSVIVDLAAEQGGNCEATVAGEIVDVGGVRVIGPKDVASSIAFHASATYGKNVANFLGLLLKDKALTINLDDDIVRESLVARDGQLVHERVREASGQAPLPVEATPEPEAEAKEATA
jgi:H+-translocating NAD(P) transhydrogenase subunit alpha